MYSDPEITIAILQNREERIDEQSCLDGYCCSVGDFVARKRPGAETGNRRGEADTDTPGTATATTEEAGSCNRKTQTPEGFIPWPTLYGEPSNPVDWSRYLPDPAPAEDWPMDGEVWL